MRIKLLLMKQVETYFFLCEKWEKIWLNKKNFIRYCILNKDGDDVFCQ